MMEARHGIRLFLADVDRSLVTREKILTEAAKAAVRELRGASIAFAITSGRPPAPEHCVRADRRPGRHAERCADVPQERLLHRDGNASDEVKARAKAVRRFGLRP
jgi:hypothetical protein